MKTQGIKYTGSKKEIIPYIFDAACGLNVYTFLDAFSGTTRVSQAASMKGMQVTCNDLAEYSKVFGNCYLKSDKHDSWYQTYIDDLNLVKGYRGWFSEHYGGTEDDPKHPFQMHNAMKLDAIRDQIDRYGLEYEDKCVLLTSLILALDKVDNTIGHYAAYLSKWSQRSYDNLHLELPQRPIGSGAMNKVTQVDAMEAVKEYHDLIYLDPPYGSNNDKMPSSRVRYNAYYHLWKTVVLNDKPKVFGKAMRRVDSKDSEGGSLFESYKKDESGRYVASIALENLIRECNCHYIMLSYSNHGRVPQDEIIDILNQHGKLIDFKEIDYKKNVMANMVTTKDYVVQDDDYKELLFLLEKS